MAENYVQFVPRYSRPTAGNKYYIKKTTGGYSDAIYGKCAGTSQPDPDCNTLANCVGYAYGRFNEIGGYGYCKYLRPVDAGKFIEYTDLPVTQEPTLGGCMVWSKDGGAGHVAIVEKIVNAQEIITSESGYNGPVFWTETRKIGSDGNWGQRSVYHYLGCIQNPAVKPEPIPDILDVDGDWSLKTTYYTQLMFGTELDEEISSQSFSDSKYLVACNRKSWQIVPDDEATGSDVIAAIQVLVGVNPDRFCGRKTIKAMQRFLRGLGYYSGRIDGYLGPETVMAWQMYVNAYFAKAL